MKKNSKYGGHEKEHHNLNLVQFELQSRPLYVQQRNDASGPIKVAKRGFETLTEMIEKP